MAIPLRLILPATRRTWLTAVLLAVLVLFAHTTLVSNALKHAFPKDRKGSMPVRLVHLNDHMMRLSVEDDGVGLPPGLDFRHTQSLGLQPAVTLTSQPDGTMVVDSSHGAGVHITFSACQQVGR